MRTASRRETIPAAYRVVCKTLYFWKMSKTELFDSWSTLPFCPKVAVVISELLSIFWFCVCICSCSGRSFSIWVTPLDFITFQYLITFRLSNTYCISRVKHLCVRRLASTPSLVYWVTSILKHGNNCFMSCDMIRSCEECTCTVPPRHGGGAVWSNHF